MRIGPDETWLYAGRAFAHRRAGDLPFALADLDELVRLDAKSAEALAGRCSVKILSNQLEGAFEDCQQALTLDGTQQEARLDRAFLYLQRHQLDEATADCNAVLADDPQSAPALATLSQIRQARASKANGAAKTKG